MKRRLLHPILQLLFLTIFSLTQLSCTALLDTLENIQRLQFKLGGVNNFQLAGVRLNTIRSASDISVLDAAKLLASFAQGQLPASFTLNVLAKNPNDGTG